MKELSMPIPRARDEYEYKFFLAAKESVNGLRSQDLDEKTFSELSGRFWNIYFWTVFRYRAKKVDHSRFTVKYSR